MILSTSDTKPAAVDNPLNSSRAFPTSHPAEAANIIFVADDWSDLESTVAWLEAHRETAEQIARNQRDLMVGKGYLSAAANTCYWRALIRRWAGVARPKLEGSKAWSSGWELEGMPWETFALEDRVHWG